MRDCLEYCEPAFALDFGAEAAAIDSSASYGSRRLTALKRVFDFGAALVLLVALCPFLLALAAVMTLTGDGPVLFAHRRIGRGGKTFPCFKFRTMYRDADTRLLDVLERDAAARREWEHKQKLANDPRVTKIGRVLRKTSLDELPQLLNVLRGEMSLVGPRPIVEAEVRRYGSVFSLYTAVTPGITGLWQVSGRNNTTYSERVELDRRYVLSGSFIGDLSILCKTFAVLLLVRNGC